MGSVRSALTLCRLTLARPPLASHLDIIKFICKDLFLYVYSKQIDNLRTNHRVSSHPRCRIQNVLTHMLRASLSFNRTTFRP